MAYDLSGFWRDGLGIFATILGCTSIIRNSLIGRFCYTCYTIKTFPKNGKYVCEKPLYIEGFGFYCFDTIGDTVEKRKRATVYLFSVLERTCLTPEGLSDSLALFTIFTKS